MNTKAKAHIDPALGNIVSLCRECNVAWLVLFGSSLKEEWDERRSDFDFGVKFEKQGGAFDKLLWGLLLLLKRVHLIDVDAVQNPYFAQVIVTEGERIF
jgi:predicted nucleotidyltransferase